MYINLKQAVEKVIFFSDPSMGQQEQNIIRRPTWSKQDCFWKIINLNHWWHSAICFLKNRVVEGKKFFLSHPPSIFQEHAAQRCQRRKPKGCENGKRRAKLGNKLGKGNMHLLFSTSCKSVLIIFI